jgi:SAM-dependent methyltransferase
MVCLLCDSGRLHDGPLAAETGCVNEERYNALAAQKARHWESVRADPQNPQILDDEQPYEIFFGPEFGIFVQTILDASPDILELGCGGGNLAVCLASAGKHVTAIDLSTERLQRAREKSRLLDRPPVFLQADLSTHQLARNQFNSHLLGQVDLALRPGGSIIVYDYVGMGGGRRILAALLYALLPTFRTYRKKWKLRTRLAAFLATEQEKRKSLENESASTLHADSPFEEISQASIVESIQRQFSVLEFRSTLPFFFYLVAKLRVPRQWRSSFARILRRADDLLLRFGIPGAYFFLHATKS